jgi:hypothetical protein
MADIVSRTVTCTVLLLLTDGRQEIQILFR